MSPWRSLLVGVLILAAVGSLGIVSGSRIPDKHTLLARRKPSDPPQVSHLEKKTNTTAGVLVVAHAGGELGWIKDAVGFESPFAELVIYPAYMNVTVGGEHFLVTMRETRAGIDALEKVLNHRVGLTVKEGTVENTAAEAGKYLDFIVERYDDFPEFATFVHSHSGRWHDPPNKIEALRSVRPESLTDGIQFLSGYCIESLPNDIVLWAWPQLLGDIYPKPFRYVTPCCAQFTVSRAAVLNRPKAFWERLRHFAYNYDPSSFTGRVTWPAELDSNGAGYILEWMWKPIFSMVQVADPSFNNLPEVFRTCSAVCNQTWITKRSKLAPGKDLDYSNAADFHTECLPEGPRGGGERLPDACYGYDDEVSSAASPSRELLHAWGCEVSPLVSGHRASSNTTLATRRQNGKM